MVGRAGRRAAPARAAVGAQRYAASGRAAVRRIGAWRALAVALLALALVPAVASAHATLQETIPARGQKLDAVPAQVVFRFDEPVEAAFGALRVFDAQGNEVQTGEAFHPGGRGAEIAIRLKSGLGDGSYTATYRVVSADGHAISSGFVFAVGDSTAPAESLEALLADSGTGPVTNTALAFARAFQYAAIALGLGTLIFFLYCWRGASHAFTRRLERLLLIAAIVGFLSAAVAVVLQGAVGQGGTFWAAAKPDVVSEVLGTRFGRAWGIGAAVWLVVLAVLALRPLRGGGALAKFAPGEVSEGTPRPPAPRTAATAPRYRPAPQTMAAEAACPPAPRTRDGAAVPAGAADAAAHERRRRDRAGPRRSARRGRGRARRSRRRVRARRRGPALRARRHHAPRGHAEAARARRPPLRARAAALARRPHERAEAGRDPAAGEHPARAGDERLAGRHRRARVRAARGDLGARARVSGRRCWRARSRASRCSPRSRCPS